MDRVIISYCEFLPPVVLLAKRRQIAVEKNRKLRYAMSRRKKPKTGVLNMLIRNAAVYSGSEFVRGLDVRVRDGRIIETGAGLHPEAGEKTTDLEGDFLVPGFVDVHIHAFGGQDTMQGEAAVRAMSRELRRLGVAAFCPTTMSADPEETLRAVRGIRAAAPFIRNMFETSEIDGEPWAKYAAGYMWGVTGLVYNPELVSEDQVSSWKALADPAFKRQVTIKDSVRESYFAAVGAIKSDLLTSEAFRSAPDYKKQLEIEMNDTSPEMIGQVQDWLKTVKDNVYSFETDAGKADMITGKVAINYQWSGDAVYTLDQADEDDFTLCFAVPEESTDIYFDGWVMLKRGIEQDPRKQHAAEAFINFLSRPDNTIRNMYYIGYTSVLSGGDDPRILEYARYCYEAEDDEEDTVDYDLSYFFAEEGESGDYTITAAEDQMNRQLFSAYPPEDVIARSSIMSYFNDEQNAEINKMWVNVRCFDIRKAPIWGWFLFLAAAGVGFWSLVLRRKDR